MSLRCGTPGQTKRGGTRSDWPGMTGAFYDFCELRRDGVLRSLRLAPVDGIMLLWWKSLARFSGKREEEGARKMLFHLTFEVNEKHRFARS